MQLGSAPAEFLDLSLQQQTRIERVGMVWLDVTTDSGRATRI
jgi:hypothetical protein